MEIDEGQQALISETARIAPSAAAGRMDGALDRARADLIGHLAGQVKADGSVPGPCKSRTLESALLLVLLRADGRHPREKARLTDFLTAGAGSIENRFDTALRGAVLTGATVDAVWVHEELLADFDHFSSVRKRLLFDVCLALVGAIPFNEEMAPERIRPENRVHWVEMIMLALKVLIAHGLRTPGTVTEADRDRLLKLLWAGQRGGVWENHVTAHLLALLAVQAFSPHDPVIAEGIGPLLGCQNDDGGIPGIANLSVFCTGPAGLALARAGADRDLLQQMGDYLAGEQLPDGGWPFGENMVQSDVDTSSYAVSFLATADSRRHRATLDRAGAYLRNIAGEDGGFPTYLRGDPAEVGMTSGGASALGWFGEEHADLVERSAHYLLDSQKPDGTFERSWSLSEANTIWRAMWALHALPPARRPSLSGRIRAAAARSLRFLDLAQNADGGWGYRPGYLSDTTSTAYSVLALSAMGRQLGRDVTLRRGVFHLLARQEADGSVAALPDQVAPRPLLFDAPVFAGIWALLALASCDQDQGSAR
jgi:squalene-hopene/tetraprenyl-beta-curcumene cyclase